MQPTQSRLPLDQIRTRFDEPLFVAGRTAVTVTPVIRFVVFLLAACAGSWVLRRSPAPRGRRSRRGRWTPASSPGPSPAARTGVRWMESCSDDSRAPRREAPRPHRAGLPDRHTEKGFHPRRLATSAAVSTGPE